MLARPSLVLAWLLACSLWSERGSAAPSVRPQLVQRLPHASDAFTQGLLLHDGFFYESTGLYGSSTLRRVLPETGAVLHSIALAETEFGEGLARVDQRLVQLTWQEQVAHVYDLESFEELTRLSYTGEGWGLCYDGERLVMSDGSDRLFFRDAVSFELLGSLSVVNAGVPVDDLNELECLGDVVLANVWQTDEIVRIDAESGEVLHEVDASGLLTPEEAAAADVLNGIAYDGDSGNYFLTGKLWPWVFEVELAFDTDNAAEQGSGSSCRVQATGQNRGRTQSFWAFVLLAWVWRQRARAPGAGARFARQ